MTPKPKILVFKFQLQIPSIMGQVACDRQHYMSVAFMHHSIAHIYTTVPSVIVKTSMCLYIYF